MTHYPTHSLTGWRRLKADWVGFDNAVQAILDAIQPLEIVECELHDARGAALGEDMISSIALPPWTNSAMDGFAVHAAAVQGATADAPIELPVVDDIAAGAFPLRPINHGEAARVMTGAPVPDGADSVIRVEHTDGGSGWQTEHRRVRILNAQDAGRNLRRKGEEMERGAIALPAGEAVSAATLGVAASLGYARVKIVRRPEVALLTSGDELVDLDRFEEVLAGRKIVSSNSYTLAAQLTEIGCRVRHLGISGDSPESLRSALIRAIGCDAIVTSAGISVGEHDHVRRVLIELGADVAFWRVRIRPGSPFAFGRIRELANIPWFGLPGNPVSSMVTFELFAKPALLRMAGHRDVQRRRIHARLLEDFDAPSGLTHFLRVRLGEDGSGGWTARLTGPQGSGILSSLAQADGLLVIPENQAGASAGAVLPVIPLDRGLFSSPARTRDEG